MDPLASSAPRASVLRPSSGGDAAAILRDGRVLTARVVDSRPTGEVVLQIGKHRLPASARVELRVGEPLLLKVEDGALRVLETPSSKATSPALQKLRVALASAEARGESTATLLGRLSSSPDLPAELRAWLRTIPLKSDLSAAGVAERLAAFSGQESALLELAVLDTAGGSKAERMQLFASLLVERALLLSGGSDGARAPFLKLIDSVLSRIFAGPASADPALLADSGAFTRFTNGLLGDLAAEVRRLASADRAVLETRAALERGLAQLEAGGLQSRALTSLLRQVLGERVSSERVEELRRALRGNAKVALMHGLAEAEPRDRSAIERLLANIELDQLKNLVRSEGGDPRHLSLPFMEDGVWRNLDLFIGREAAANGREEEAATRFVMGVELSALGPIRIDATLRSQSVALRVTVASDAAASSIRAALGSLEERLTAGERSVRAHVAVAPLEAASTAELREELSLLDERRLMDLNA